MVFFISEMLPYFIEFEFCLCLYLPQARNLMMVFLLVKVFIRIITHCTHARSDAAILSNFYSSRDIVTLSLRKFTFQRRHDLMFFDTRHDTNDVHK